MDRYGSLIQVKPDHEERYIILHNNTFPGVIKQIALCNISNYSIFLRHYPDGIMLFSFFEYTGDDFNADMDKMAADPLTQDWWKLTIPMQEPLESRKEGEWWATIGELFHMDGVRKPPEKVRRYASTVDILPENEDEYRNLHTSLSPGILENIQRANISNYSIFMHESRVYSYFEYAGDDFEKDMERMTIETETCTWLDACKTLQYKIPTGKNSDWWSEMREVFHTD